MTLESDGRNPSEEVDGVDLPGPALVSTAFSLCITHQAIDHDDGRAWSGCRFRQLFYFENPMDEHTLMWSDEAAAASDPTERCATPAADSDRIGPGTTQGDER